VADQFRMWLDRRTATVEMERRVAKAVVEAGADAPIHKFDRRAQPSPAELRGIPAIGAHVDGAVPGTRPERAVLRRR
jgi:hypothetical protein